MSILPGAERFRAIVRGQAHDLSARCWRSMLWWLRYPYGLVVWIRNQLYQTALKKSVRVPAVVISVGNLSMGGTGKTPCVEYLARLIRDLGHVVVLISRGYGASQGPNDEALLLEENLPDVPHLQNPDRVEAALAAFTELEGEVLILDDGFQHRRIHRDLNIVLVDSSTPLFSDYLFPRGMLREPISGLTRADLVILTRWDGSSEAEGLRAELARRFPGLSLYTARHEPLELLDCDGTSYQLDYVNGRPLAMLCGIGNPDSFRTTLQGLPGQSEALPADRCQLYPDHHNYTRQDVDKLQSWAATLPDSTLILTTQKDLVKLRLSSLAGRVVLAVRVEFRFVEGEAEFCARVRKLLPLEDEV